MQRALQLAVSDGCACACLPLRLSVLAHGVTFVSGSAGADPEEIFDYMQAEDMQREDEAAADAFMAEMAESTAPACYLPQLASLIERPGMHSTVVVRTL